MTNEEAIKMLEYIQRVGNGESEYKNDAQAIAIDMAIKALETVERINTRKQELEKKLQSNYSNSWAIEYCALVKLLSDAEMIDYKRAFEIACELLNDHWLFGWDRDKIFEQMMADDGVVSSFSWERFILAHISELSGTEAENDE